MSKQTIFNIQLFEEVPVIGIIRGMEISIFRNILQIYVAAGLTTIEITMNTKSAEDMIHYVSEEYSGQLNIGAGTVCNEKDLDKALSSGAQFIVTPIVNEDVILECVKNKIPIFPGALTPTEIYRAWELGATMVKVFPATYFGASYIKEIKAPLDRIKLLPTGGIDRENMDAFMRAGADGLGIGSKLFDKELIRSEKWIDLKKHFETFSRYFINGKKANENA